MKLHPSRRTAHRLGIGAALLPLLAGAASAQDRNVLLAVERIERALREDSFSIVAWRGARQDQDRTQRAELRFADGTLFTVKWACAPYGGSEFNNEPRYELAAYELQKLFLEPDEYVVPPTVLRAFPVELVQTLEPRAEATFAYTGSTLVLLQYWLSHVTADGFWDEQRFARDTVYARFLANFNVLTYLIRHKDGNEGNFLISLEPARPRVFSVDNGISFRSLESNRGQSWRRLRVDRIPARTVARLRAVTEADLTRALAVLAEFRALDGRLIAADPGPNLGRREGVRAQDGTFQLGLTRPEIAGTYRRLQRLLGWIEEGTVRTF